MSVRTAFHPPEGRSAAVVPPTPLGGLARLAATVRRIIGAPDYAAYLAHVRAAHLGREPLTEQEFVADRLRARYEQVGSRCC